ncbi:MAG: hypothetical protein MI975_07685 [Cytophagales bacterium]|nr:hypothetical protein [Cytophagales bacterium]
MYTNYTFSFRRTLKGLWWLWVLSIIYAYLIYFLSAQFTISIPAAIPAVLGTAVSLLLGFRTNAAYNRWWEARKIWGAIVNDSRTFARQVKGFIPKEYPDYELVVKRLVNLQIAFVYALRNSLRQTGTKEDYEMFMLKNDLALMDKQSNKANAILDIQERVLSELHTEKTIDSIQFANLDNTLKSLCDSMGKSERIKNTVFPIQYSSFTRMAIIIYAILFPFGAITQKAISMVLLTFVVVFFFLLIDAIGTYLKDPFENRKSDTPLSAIARTIEINLLEMIGENDIPKKPEAEKGVLM